MVFFSWLYRTTRENLKKNNKKRQKKSVKSLYLLIAFPLNTYLEIWENWRERERRPENAFLEFHAWQRSTSCFFFFLLVYIWIIFRHAQYVSTVSIQEAAYDVESYVSFSSNQYIYLLCSIITFRCIYMSIYMIIISV